MKFIIALLLISSVSKADTVMCDVMICNKIERFSLSIWSHIKDHMGENCFAMQIPKDQAVEGKIIDSNSKRFQGSFNPTKKSVTRVKKVFSCHGS